MPRFSNKVIQTHIAGPPKNIEMTILLLQSNTFMFHVSRLLSMLQDTDGGPGMGGHSSVYTCAFIKLETKTWSNYLKRGDGWDIRFLFW